MHIFRLEKTVHNDYKNRLAPYTNQRWRPNLKLYLLIQGWIQGQEYLKNLMGIS